MIVRDRRKEMRWKFRTAQKTTLHSYFLFEFPTKYCQTYKNKFYHRYLSQTQDLIIYNKIYFDMFGNIWWEIQIKNR